MLPTAELIEHLDTYKTYNLWAREHALFLLATKEQVLQLLSIHTHVSHRTDYLGNLFITRFSNSEGNTKEKTPLAEAILYQVKKAHPAPLVHGKLLEKLWRYGSTEIIKKAVIELELDGRLLRTRDGDATIYTLPSNEVLLEN